ncbi:MAG: hypothetical protein ACFFCM_11515 [Promethearchaeota archaeon]
MTGRVVGYKKEDSKEIVERVGVHWSPNHLYPISDLTAIMEH